MIFYPDAPTIKTVRVPFPLLWHEGGSQLVAPSPLADFFATAFPTPEDMLKHPYANWERYVAGLRHKDPAEKEKAALALLVDRKAWFDKFDHVNGQLLPLAGQIQCDGKIELFDGHHRAAMLWAKGCKWVTVDVKYVSPSWLALEKSLKAIAANKRQVYSPIEHPWFDDWPTLRDRTAARETLIINAVEEYRAGIWSRIWCDVGCCTGRLCREVSRRGWFAVGLEYEPVFLHAAETLSRGLGAQGTEFFLNGDFESFLPSTSWDYWGCISILSVLHHWLLQGGKGDEAFTAAVKLIASSTSLFVIDIDPASNGYVSQANTKIPLNQEGFEKWLREVIGCTMVRYLGTVDLGRPIFLCSRRLSS